MDENSFSFLTKKQKVKGESPQEKFNRNVFEACKKWVLNSDSESDFNTHLEQVKSEKSRKRSTKVKWNYENRKINKD